MVPREQKIQMDQWQRVFLNTHFGFTGMVQHFSHDSKEALRQLQEEKLLLETDAPYFRIGGRAHSSPALIGMVADMVAKIRGQTWKQVLLKQGYRYHNIRKAFSKFYHRHSELIVKYNIGLKTLLQQGISEPIFYGLW